MQRCSYSASAALLLLCLAVFLPIHAHAQQYDWESGNGVPNQSWNPSLIYEDSIFEFIPNDEPDNLGHARASMMDGYLFVPTFLERNSAGGELDIYELADANGDFAPRLVKRITDFGGSNPIREAHAYGTTFVDGKRIVVMQGKEGIVIWDMSDLKNKDPHVIGRVTLDSGVGGRNYQGIWWVSLQYPYVYATANGSGLFVVDISDLDNIQTTNMSIDQIGGFRVGAINLVGDFAVLTSNSNTNENASAGGGAWAFIDTSDPMNPSLIRTMGNGNRDDSQPDGYGVLVNGEQLLWGGRGEFFMSMDISDPNASDLPWGFVDFNDSDVFGNQNDRNNSGGYVNIQDNFAFVGAQMDSAKIDISDPGNPVFVSGGNGSRGIDEDVLDHNFAVPLGNLLFASNDRTNEGSYSELLYHDSEPDTKGPDVNMVRPQNGTESVPVTTGIGLTFTDELEDRSILNGAIELRPVGGSPVPIYLSYQSAIVNIRPHSDLQAGVTYEVVVNEGLVKDVVGNGGSSFVSTFTTAGTAVPDISVTIADPEPALVGENVTFSVDSVSGVAPLEFQWSFGDGNTLEYASANQSVSHVYGEAGTFSVTVTVRDAIGRTSSYQAPVVITNPLDAFSPTYSSTIAYNDGDGFSYNVNPDNDTVTVIDVSNGNKVAEIPVGENPRTLTIAPDGQTVWVANGNGASISVIDTASLTVSRTIDLPRASQPFGITFNPNGAAVYVTLHATAQVVQIDPTDDSMITVDIPGKPRGIAVSGDAERIFVTRFKSPVTLPNQGGETGAEVYELSASDLNAQLTIDLPIDTTSAQNSVSGRGIPNYLTSIAVSPDGNFAWVPSKKDNIRRGHNGLDPNSLTHESTVRTILTKVDLTTHEVVGFTDFDNSDMANAVAISPLGDLIYVAFQGVNKITIVNASSMSPLVDFATDFAPQGIALTPDGQTLLVHNFMSRTVQVIDVSDNPSLESTTGTVANEKLTPSILLGKQIFYNADDNRMNLEGYMSCATCHLDGGSDGRVWDFTQRGEGFRRSTDLRGRSGMAHGPVHWSGNFDEIHDFENDMRLHMNGQGFLTPEDFAASEDPLGTQKTGLSPELDALAAYVSSLTEAPASPYREADGSLTDSALEGKQIFIDMNCATCHAGPRMTDSALNRFHRVGTLKQTSGSRLGVDFDDDAFIGLDTPTLKGIWSNDSFGHDGARASLSEFMAQENHGGAGLLSQSELDSLIDYLKQIDESETPAYLKSSDGLIVIEAESFAAANTSDTHSWVPFIDTVNNEGIVGVTAFPNDGTSEGGSSAETSSPRLDYKVHFTQTGTYYLFIRGSAETSEDNHVYYGKDGVLDRRLSVSAGADGYVWSTATRTIEITETGIQTINLWMREDGIKIDQILLTTDSSYTPPAIGFLESATAIDISVEYAKYTDWLVAFNHQAGADTHTEGDADGGLLNNLLEYAFGGDPSIATDDVTLFPQMHQVEGSSEIIYSYLEHDNKDEMGLSYIVEYTHALDDVWTRDGVQIIDVQPADGDFSVITVSLPESVTDATFIRCRIELR
ncbi:MAG: Ig-like domain-containing protein [Opitutales bacterium]